MSRFLVWFDGLSNRAKAAFVSGLETVTLTVWLVTYPLNPTVSTAILIVGLIPEHYLALRK